MYFDISTINEYLRFVLNIVAIFALLYAILCFFSDDARVKLYKIKQRLQEVKNLKEKHIDDFQFDSLFDLRFPQGIDKNKCAAGTRTLHSSNESNNKEYIKAHSNNGKLVLEYKFLKHNTNSWLSYVIQEMDEIKNYCKKGYYMSFSCSSKNVTEFLLEVKHPERKFPIHVTPKVATYFGKLIDMIDADKIDDFAEICFVLKTTTNNELQGCLEISDLKLLKNIKTLKNGKRI